MGMTRLQNKIFILALIFTLLITMLGFSACSGSSSRSIQTPLPPATQTEPQLQPPAPPLNLTGEPISQSVVQLHWLDNSRNEDGFRVYRDADIIATVEEDTAVYKDIGLEAEKTYYYIVRAYNAVGESEVSSCTVKMPNPPLNVTINYIGVKDDHDPYDIFQGPGDIRLLLVVSDGDQTIEAVLPPSEGTYPLDDYETVELAQRVFHSASVGDYLKIAIIAYDDDPEERISQVIQVASILAPILGVPYVGDIGTIFSQYEEQTGKPLFENADDYVGYFEGFWGADESWGIGQHNAVGTQDFRIWFSIWSDSEPLNIPKPMLSPDVMIESVDLPAEVEVSKTYTYHVRLCNSESHAVAVVLRWDSSLTGGTRSQSVTVPANGFMDVTFTTKFEPAGVRTVKYTLFYQGAEIDSMSKTVEAKAPDVMIESVDLPAEVIAGKSYIYHITLRNNSPTSASVILKIHSSVTGDVGSKSVTIPANNSVTVTDTRTFEPPGVRTITYTVLYKGEEIHSLTKTIEAKAPVAFSVNFVGWYIDSSKVETALKDDTVTAKVSLTGGEAGNYKLRVKRDIIWATDQIVDELSFNYDGVSTVKELSFVPPYATGEANTDGYFIVLVKDGDEIWGLPNIYPPRLKVMLP